MQGDGGRPCNTDPERTWIEQYLADAGYSQAMTQLAGQGRRICTARTKSAHGSSNAERNQGTAKRRKTREQPTPLLTPDLTCARA